MKITENVKNGGVELCCIPPGTCFKVKGDSALYMKTVKFSGVNVINLVSGNPLSLHISTNVVPYRNAEVVLNAPSDS